MFRYRVSLCFTYAFEVYWFLISIAKHVKLLNIENLPSKKLNETIAVGALFQRRSFKKVIGSLLTHIACWASQLHVLVDPVYVLSYVSVDSGWVFVTTSYAPWYNACKYKGENWISTMHHGYSFVSIRFQFQSGLLKWVNFLLHLPARVHFPLTRVANGPPLSPAHASLPPCATIPATKKTYKSIA